MLSTYVNKKGHQLRVTTKVLFIEIDPFNLAHCWAIDH